MADAISSQGLTFTFDGTAITVTSVSVSDTADVVDASHLGQDKFENRLYVNGFLTDRELTIDYFSDDILSAGVSGNLSITGPIGFSGPATITSATLGGSVGDVVRGTASFKVKTT